MNNTYKLYTGTHISNMPRYNLWAVLEYSLHDIDKPNDIKHDYDQEVHGRGFLFVDHGVFCRV